MSKHINEIFRENLKYYLEIKGKTQKDLAEYLNISTAMANYYTKGTYTPRMDKVDKICKFLNIDRADLLEQRELNKKSIKDLDTTGINRIAAQFEGENFSDSDLDEIQNFIYYVQAKNKVKNKENKNDD